MSVVAHLDLEKISLVAFVSFFLMFEFSFTQYDVAPLVGREKEWPSPM
jgi:hypothetical protein